VRLLPVDLIRLLSQFLYHGRCPALVVPEVVVVVEEED
jgi:hypothetical protein